MCVDRTEAREWGGVLSTIKTIIECYIGVLSSKYIQNISSLPRVILNISFCLDLKTDFVYFLQPY